MPDYAPPEDLIDLKTRWYAAQALAAQIAAEEPAGEEITVRPPTGAGLVVPDGQAVKTIRLFSDEQNGRLSAARNALRDLTMEIFRHPWKQQQPDRHEAEKALNALALERYEASLAA